MNIARSLVVSALLLVFASASPAWARVVSFRTAAPLGDRSDFSIDRAVKGAVDNCVREATAMGLSWIWLRDAAVVGDKILIQMVASDDGSEESDGDVTVVDLTPNALR